MTDKLRGEDVRKQELEQAETRFDEFDDDDHPFRKWWVKYGQFMLSGGGRRESIWAARGWIAREQLICGVEVTGDSMLEHSTTKANARELEEENRKLRSALERIADLGSQFPLEPRVQVARGIAEAALRRAEAEEKKTDRCPECRQLGEHSDACSQAGSGWAEAPTEEKA